ncbi:hypothetical protein [Nocardioides sp. Bht2]|uniref:hypothetical protein n=1 Tax=Nocardioides sp. Bht2 TaxID=3392297 RepID=UPI0039B4A9C0
MVEDAAGYVVDGVTGVADAVTGAAGSVGENVAGSLFGGFVDAMVEAANWTIEKIMTLWLKAPAPDVTGSDSPAAWVTAHLSYLVAAAMVATLIYGGIRLMIYARASEAVNLAEAMVRMLLTTVLAGFLITTGVELSEAFSVWILDRAELDLDVKFLTAAGMAPGVVMILALFVVIAQLIQLGFMIVRNAVIVLLAGTINLAAAASGTRMGREAFNKQVSWLIAFILYKPTAALIYALSFTMASGEDLWEQLSGIVLMILSVLALPALQRLIAPVTAQIGGANAGALAGATVGAGVALGAMALTGGASAAAGAGGAGGFLGGAGGGGFAGGAASGGAGGRGPSGANTAGLSSGSSSGSGSAGAIGGSTPGGAPQVADGGSDLSQSAGVSGGPSGADGSAGLAPGASPGQGGGSVSGGAQIVGGGADSSPAGAVSSGGSSATPSGAGGGSGSAAVARGVQTGQGAFNTVQSAAEDSTGDGGPSGAGRADG